MPELDWERLRHELAPDGSLRDILVPSSAAIDQWQRLWDRLRKPDLDPAFHIGGEVAELPPTIVEAFALANDGNLVVLKFTFERLCVHCFLWIDNDVEFTIDPAESIGDDGMRSVIGLLRMIGNTVGAAAQLTEENAPDEVILRYDPVGERLYQPPSQWT